MDNTERVEQQIKDLESTIESLDDIAEQGKPLYKKMQAEYLNIFGRPRKRSEWSEKPVLWYSYHSGRALCAFCGADLGVVEHPHRCMSHEIAEGMKDVWRNQQAGSE